MEQEFGTTLKALRRTKGLSQFALATQIGTTQRHLSFLETGRAQPGAAMLARLSAGLELGAGQRAALYAASPIPSPYRQRSFDDEAVRKTLDMLDAHLLAHWPFPAFVIDQDWTILRLNPPAQRMFSPFASPDGLNIFTLILSPAFRMMVENWDEAASAIFFRLQKAARHSAKIAEGLAAAQQENVFSGVQAGLDAEGALPIFVPLVLRLPDGTGLRLGSLLGKLASVHDSLIEGLEVEMMVPVDEESEHALSALNAFP